MVQSLVLLVLDVVETQKISPGPPQGRARQSPPRSSRAICDRSILYRSSPSAETEKNLDRIFAAAESANLVLFFDEAAALFGKRTEVKDSHDRYANIEVGYLLQKMDEYGGIAILATNLRQNLHEGFIHRFQIVVEFPIPDETARRRIWSTIFPREAPLAPGVDFDWLAREVRLSGGKIRNIAISAAFQAASGDGIISMTELIEAARRETEKSGQTWRPTDWEA